MCLSDVNKQCRKNREGPLCSQCVKGTSAVLGSEDCKDDCTNMYLLLLLPGLLILSLFVLIILYFNFDVFSGYLNAYLYVYQTIFLLIPNSVKLGPFI